MLSIILYCFLQMVDITLGNKLVSNSVQPNSAQNPSKSMPCVYLYFCEHMLKITMQNKYTKIDVRAVVVVFSFMLIFL